MTALSAALVGSVSYATSNDALLDLLVKKGVLTDSEATAVAAELKEENKGVTFSSKGKEIVKLRFNGRMHIQYDSLDSEDNGRDVASTNHFYFRRLRLGAKATHENGLFAETVVDFAEDGLSIDKAVAGITTHFHKNDVKYTIDVAGKSGGFSSQVIDFSTASNADMILIMTNPEKGLSSFILGSYDEEMIFNTSQIPVMCVNPRDYNWKKIVPY